MEHQRDRAAPATDTTLTIGLTIGLTVGSDLLSELFDGLTQQVGQHVRAVLAGHAVGVDVAGGGDPHGELGLDGAGQSPHFARVWRTTWSPGWSERTAEPTSSTPPAP